MFDKIGPDEDDIKTLVNQLIIKLIVGTQHNSSYLLNYAIDALIRTPEWSVQRILYDNN